MTRNRLLVDMMKSEAGTNIITNVYNQARYEETHKSDEEDNDGDMKMPAVDETATGVATLPTYTTPSKTPATITTTTPSQVAPLTASLPVPTLPTGKMTRSRTIRPEVYLFVKQTEHGDVPPIKTETIRHDAKWFRIKQLPEKQRKKAYRDWEIAQHWTVLAKNLDPFLVKYENLAKKRCGLKEQHQFTISERLYLKANGLDIHIKKSHYRYKLNAARLRALGIKKEVNSHEVHPDTLTACNYAIREYANDVPDLIA